MTLAIAKEMLGYVRGKYSTIPIPNADMTLNQADLISAASSEKTALIERLRTFFDTTSRKTLLEKNFASVKFKNSETTGGAEVLIEWLDKDLRKI